MKTAEKHTFMECISKWCLIQKNSLVNRIMDLCNRKVGQDAMSLMSNDGKISAVVVYIAGTL